ncbi:FAD-dependent monooxygenase [Actinomadura madurae]|uniref:FAD-dependent monooxygenase n=1 Tax=Actinomadura madurae TaxID=1993 RepID=UPI00399AADD6
MRLASVAVLGGGPGGLYAARLIKLARPGCVVDVYEQATPETTFGFGVGLAAGTQHNLRQADEASLADIIDHSHPHEMSLRVGDRVASMPNGNLLAIARTTLLTVLQRHAEAAGVRLHHGRRADADALDADLVIAADGVNSATRDRHAADFGAQVESGDGLYLWCGTDAGLPSALFMPVTTSAGTFVTHAYPYAPDRSTFLVETDERTWRNAGFAGTTEALASGPADASDETALRYLERAFADPLRGHALIGNRTRWLRFRTVHCERWHRGNVVLLGDAAHTAHYSIGSGTKLAMEDAIALVAALGEHGTLADALDHYEAERRPAVEHLQDVAARSRRWWDSFPGRLDLPVNRLLVAYMTRAGKVTLARFAESAPHVVGAALAEYAGRPCPGDRPPTGDALIDFVLRQPLRRDRIAVPDRTSLPEGTIVDVEFADADPWGPKADAVLSRFDQAAGSDAAAVRIAGPPDRDDLLNRLELGDRLRGRGLPVIVRGPREFLPDLAAGLVAGRADLVEAG